MRTSSRYFKDSIENNHKYELSRSTRRMVWKERAKPKMSGKFSLTVTPPKGVHSKNKASETNKYMNAYVQKWRQGKTSTICNCSNDCTRDYICHQRHVWKGREEGERERERKGTCCWLHSLSKSRVKKQNLRKKILTVVLKKWYDTFCAGMCP